MSEKPTYEELEKRIRELERSEFERKEAEEKLKESERKWRNILVNTPQIGISLDTRGKIIFVNSHFLKLTGWLEHEVMGKDWFDMFIPERVREEIRGVFKTVMHQKDEAGFSNYENEIVARSGKLLDIAWSNVLTRGLDGDILDVTCLGIDLTERKRTEEKREELRNQLIQSQKMESVGRLAGGVAHDFNNMLSIIIGYADMALEKLSPSDPLFNDLNEIEAAARRSADIVRQLLAFARKQTVEPRVLDLNELISQRENMLHRLIGEDIELKYVPNIDLWKVKMDQSQLDQILANLAVNSRDAISGVGAITIETANVAFDQDYCNIHAEFIPGEYVRLVFSDSGCGIDKTTLENIFEPFFTTKVEGKGTGLGLSTVYGIIKQNNGFIYVYSEPGQGTAFKIYLPRIKGEQSKEIATQLNDRSLTGTETILLVEDEEQILRLCRKLLENKGYKVISAEHPGEAIMLCEKHAGKIDLLITDVVMPTMNGRELKERIEALKPGISVLYMSGYTADAISHRGVLSEGAFFIQKPFSINALASKVREVLDD